ncbi:hypothetical protein PSE_p0194 (plasmid) [Pseudovibrio sp. FO-BEG1]|nr:hypothetical protein PSE_p0194 [Pseudovibrio sp. FO-BEG1]
MKIRKRRDLVDRLKLRKFIELDFCISKDPGGSPVKSMDWRRRNCSAARTIQA